MPFGWFSVLFLDIVFNNILTMQRFLDISRFLYSGGWQVCIMIKPFSLKGLLIGLMLPFLSRWTSLGRESPSYYKVVYCVHNGRSLWQKPIRYERENSMLFSSGKCPTISLPFNSLTASLLNWLSNTVQRACEWKLMSFCIDKTLMWLVLKIYLLPVLHLLIKCLATKL